MFLDFSVDNKRINNEINFNASPQCGTCVPKNTCDIANHLDSILFCPSNDLNTVSPLYTDTRYEDETYYNKSLNGTIRYLKMRRIIGDVQE